MRRRILYVPAHCYRMPPGQVELALRVIAGLFVIVAPTLLYRGCGAASKRCVTTNSFGTLYNRRRDAGPVYAEASVSDLYITC